MYHDTRNPELALLAEIKRPSPVEPAVIASFGDDEEGAIQAAIRWAWLHRRVQRMSQRRAAELCGMTNSHFSNMLAGDKYLPAQKVAQYEWVCGNTAVTQAMGHFRARRESEIVRQVAELVAEQMQRSA